MHEKTWRGEATWPAALSWDLMDFIFKVTVWKATSLGMSFLALMETSKARRSLVKNQGKLLQGRNHSPTSLGDGDLVKCHDILCFCPLTGFSFLAHMRFPLSILQPRSASLSPTHFTQNAFLSFIFFFPPSFLFLPPLSSSSLPPSLHLLDVSLRPFHIPPPPLLPPLSPVMNGSVCRVQFIFTEQGSARCQSASPSTSLSPD